MTMKLRPHYPLHFGTTVKEDKKLAAIYCKDGPDVPRDPFKFISRRRMKLIWYKYDNGEKGDGRIERLWMRREDYLYSL